MALPGAVLPGDFAIASRTTYGHVSDGMICSMRELALGEEADGILVLEPRDAGDLAPGDDARPILGIPDAVLDIAVTPDRGYCLSVRGIAREAAAAFDAPYRDPAGAALELDAEYAAAGDDGWPAQIADPTGADRLVLRRVEGLDPEATSPLWLRLRLTHSGMRPLSLAVDVTNYVMLELGQPLHAFDRHKVAGAIRARRAEPGERLTTLDGVERSLSAEDLVIADDSGAIALAGTMGGGSTEIDAASREIVLEAAHFAAPVIARQSRRHKLSSEASRRFERGVDPGLPRAASARAAELLAELGSAWVAGTTEVDLRPEPTPRLLDAAYPGRVAGSELPAAAVIRRLEQVGCAVTEADAGRLAVVPPTWRPDLVDPADFAEEVIRLEGYDRLGSTLPRVPIGIGMTAGQRHLIRATVALAMRGFVEVRNYPFTGPADSDALGLPADDPRRRALRLANPLSDEEPDLRTTLLPGLLKALARNVGRGHTDVSVFECQRVFLPDPDAPATAPRPPVDRRPTDDELAALDAALPRQPWRIAAVAAGAWELPGWWGPGRPATWSDAIESARAVCEVVDAPVSVRRAEHAAVAPGAMRPDPPGRAGGPAADRVRRGAAPPGVPGLRGAGPNDRARARAGRAAPVHRAAGAVAPAADLPGGHAGCRPGRRRGGPRRRGRGGPAGGRRRPAGVGAALRRLHRRPGRRRPPLPGVRAALPRRRPDPHRRGGLGCAGRRGGRGHPGHRGGAAGLRTAAADRPQG